MELTNQLSPARQLNDSYVDLLPYLRILLDRWRLIATIVLVAIVATALTDRLLVTKWYQSEAVLRPIATSAVEGRIAGLLGGLGGGGLGTSGLGGLAASLGGGGTTDADEYIAIMDGFEFSIALSERHQLAAELLEGPWYSGILHYLFPADPKWRIYRVLEKRFDCGFSRTTGNMTLSFVARSPAGAEKILGYYIDDLRNLLRAREITSASAAIASLREEALSTADPVLRSELYNLEAKQLQRKKMAQVEADFAFRVLDPPAASDKEYSPNTPLDCVIAALLAALGAAALVLLRFRSAEGEARRRVHQQPSADGYAEEPPRREIRRVLP